MHECPITNNWNKCGLYKDIRMQRICEYCSTHIAIHRNYHTKPDYDMYKTMYTDVPMEISEFKPRHRYIKKDFRTLLKIFYDKSLRTAIVLNSVFTERKNSVTPKIKTVLETMVEICLNFRDDIKDVLSKNIIKLSDMNAKELKIANMYFTNIVGNKTTDKRKREYELYTIENFYDVSTLFYNTSLRTAIVLNSLLDELTDLYGVSEIDNILNIYGKSEINTVLSTNIDILSNFVYIMDVLAIHKKKLSKMTAEDIEIVNLYFRPTIYNILEGPPTQNLYFTRGHRP
jgi:hypothetical protein